MDGPVTLGQILRVHRRPRGLLKVLHVGQRHREVSVTQVHQNLANPQNTVTLP